MATGASALLTVTLTGGGTGTVTSLPLGISCPTNPGACSEMFPTGTTVTLTATPDAGLTFGGWSGACTNVTGPCVVTLSSSKSVTANFVGSKLTVVTTGTGSGIAVSSPAGISCGIDCAQAFAVNGAVAVTATALPGSSFAGWSGCGATSGVGNSECDVVMTTPKTLVATFNSATLTVAKAGTGAGIVTGTALAADSTSAPIDCGSICKSSNAVGAALVLTATPDQGSAFGSWQGCTSVAGTTCNVTMSSSRTVTVVLTTARLTVTKSGAGTGTVTGTASPANGAGALINCGTTCVTNNATGTSVTLTAVPDADSSFGGWSNCPAAAGATCTVALNASLTVNALFNSVVLTVARNGSGTGTVVGTDPGDTIDCGATCTQNFPPSTTVKLQANNTDPGSAFTVWTGCTSTNGNVCSVQMTATRSVTATFTSNPLTVTVAGTGGGTGTVVGVDNDIDCGQGNRVCLAGFPPNAQATVTAQPAPGSVFTRWTGCTSTNGTTCNVTMSSSRGVTATFTSDALTVSITGHGTVTSSPSGISCTQTCSGPFAPNTPVQLTAMAASTSAFTKWTGCTSTVGNVCNVTMNSARMVSVTFTSERLSVVKASVDGGSGTVMGPEFTCGQVCFEDFPPATPVTVTATADPGSGFAGWKGCDSTSGTGGVECNTTLNAARTVTATFARFKLTVTKIGAGTVEDSSTVIDCGAICTADFAAGASVTLTATPGPNLGLVGFTGCDSVTGNTCTVTMTQARSVVVTFASFTLTIRKTGLGRGTVTSDPGGINCGATCSASFPAGTTVTLTASPTAGSSFAGFTGCAAGAGNTCTVVMTSAKAVSAAFQSP